MTSEDDDLGDKTVYEEIGRIHRFFLGWRNATVVALFAIIYFGFSLFLNKTGKYDSQYIPYIILCSTAFFVIILWLFEWRTRKLYRVAQVRGENLERNRFINGAYRGFSTVRPKPIFFRFIELSHSRTIDILVIISIISIIGVGYLYDRGKIKFNSDILKVQNKEFSQNEKEFLKCLLNEKDVAITNELKELRAEINSIKNIHRQKVEKNQTNDMDKKKPQPNKANSADVKSRVAD